MGKDKKTKKTAEPNPTGTRTRAANPRPVPVASPVVPSEKIVITPADRTTPGATGEQVATAFAEMVGPGSNIRAWVPRLDAFLARYPRWAEARFPTGDPVYRIPLGVIDALAAGSRTTCNRARRPLFDADCAEAERAFTRLCADYLPDVVGVWQNRPVRYSLLTESPPAVTREEFDQLGWSRLGLTCEAACRDLGEVEERARVYRQEMLGRVGTLLFAPGSSFRPQRDALRARASELDGVVTWPFERPQAGTKPKPPAGSVRLDSSRAALLDQLVELVRTHELVRLVTWDLPEPQGVLESVPVEAAARLTPGAVVTVVPDYANRPNNAELAQLRAQRRERGGNSSRRLGRGKSDRTPGITGRSGGPGEYATAFRLWFVENAVRSRFAGKEPAGLVASVSTALAEHLELDPERVKDLRKRYTHALR